mgnify:CR=1 FL=1
MFDTDNPVVKLCAQGITTEGTGDIAGAKALYSRAWYIATNDIDRLTAAHYMARHQSPQQRLHWNQLAVDYALNVNEDAVKATLPSLYLNLGKSHEDLDNKVLAAKYYQLADKHASQLADDGYGRMTRAGIAAALARVNAGL